MKAEQTEEKLKYQVVISWSDDDDAFIAQVPELPGCAADGQTYHEAVGRVEAVMREWLKTARCLKRPIPVPGRK